MKKSKSECVIERITPHNIHETSIEDIRGILKLLLDDKPSIEKVTYYDEEGNVSNVSYSFDRSYDSMRF